MSIIGKPAPPISLPDTTGEIVNVVPGSGSPIALFFYPTAGLFHVLTDGILLELELITPHHRIVRVHEGGLPLP
jgi:hypothetical protein